MTDGIRRAGPPLALQKLRDNFYLVQVQLTETPSADWKRLFYDTQQSPPAEFPPRAVEISDSFLDADASRPAPVDAVRRWDLIGTLKGAESGSIVRVTTAGLRFV